MEMDAFAHMLSGLDVDLSASTRNNSFSCDEGDSGINECGQILDGPTLQNFILAGKAIFTIVSEKTGTRFTFKVTRNKDKKYSASHWVALLRGPNNESDYTSIGALYTRLAGVSFYLKRGVADTAPSSKAFIYLYTNAIAKGRMPPQVAVWHEGRCARCARPLTTPESIKRLYGPECWEKIAA